MWSSSTSAIRLFTPPRTLASSISTSAQSSPEVSDRSMESTCPRMRLMRATSFCFSFPRWAIFPFDYILTCSSVPGRSPRHGPGCPNGIIEFRAASTGIPHWLERGVCHAVRDNKKYLAQRTHNCVGRRADPRDVACRALRIFGLRRAALLCAAEWSRHLPPARAHAAPARLGEDLPHAGGLFAGRVVCRRGGVG